MREKAWTIDIEKCRVVADTLEKYVAIARRTDSFTKMTPIDLEEIKAINVDK